MLVTGAAAGMLGDGDPSRAAERPLAVAGQSASAPSKTPGLVQPVAPSRYSVPRPFVRVRTSSQLRAALRRRTPTRIVLERGVYDADQAFADENGHSIYAARLGQAVLTAGIRIGSRERGTG